MKRTGTLPRMICLALTAGIIPVFATAAEPGVLAQDLVKVRGSGRVCAAIWTRRPDSYTLQLATGAPATRVSFFIHNTVANLRCLDPSLCTRTPTLVDGKRVEAGNQAESPGPSEKAGPQAGPQKVVAQSSCDPLRVQVWLLRVDGTQVLPGWRSPPPEQAKGCGARCDVDGEIQFRFPLAESAQAVAVAIQADDEYYIEKLEPLEPRQPAL